MQYYFFHLMSWPFLPDTFERDNDSAWVWVPNQLYDPAKGHDLYREYIDTLAYADEVGFTIYDQETFSVREMRQISSKRLYRERYGTRLFGSARRMAIDQNRSAAQDRDLRIPLIYRLAFPRRRWKLKVT